MRVRTDFSQPAVVPFDGQAWVRSPMPGVERIMLDRVGSEVARATSLVRYAPASRFEAHEHAQGEELLVLQGTFSDERGDYVEGTYVRNPPGSRHAPWSDQGCIIFVKLRQFAEDDDQRVVRDVRRWTDGLHRKGLEQVCIERWAAGAHVDEPVPRGAELLVLEGSVLFAGTRVDRWGWLRVPAETRLQLETLSTTTAWVKRGHLNP